MLRKGSILLIVILLGSVFSCTNSKNTITNDDIRLRIDIQKFTSNTELYKIREQAIDTIFSWIDAKLDSRSADDTLMYGKTFILDSILAINANKDKVIMAKLYSNIDLPNAVMDAITYFYGIKINNKWYFFNGPIIHLPREYYQEDIHTPLSFETLKLIAVKEIFYNYLKKGKNGQYEINDKFFSDLTSGAWCVDCKTQESWDNSWLKLCNENWSRRNKD